MKAGNTQTLLLRNRQEARLLLSSGAAANVLPWPKFSRSWILKCAYLENCGLAKMLRYVCYRGLFLPSKVTNANVMLHNLDLNFQGQTFPAGYFDKARKNTTITIAMRCDDGYLYQDLDLHFKVTIFEMWISRKRWEPSQKNAPHVFYSGWYLPSKGIVANVVLSDRDLRVQGQHFLVIHLLQNSVFGGCPRQICLHSHCPAVELLLLDKNLTMFR